MIFLTAFFVALVSMFAIDIVWLTSMMSRFYKPRMEHLLASEFSMVPAIVFYLIYAFVLTYLVIVPAYQSGSWQTAVVSGLLFGLAAYATYDLTNQATLKNWPLDLSLVDMAWGSFLTGTVSFISYRVLSYVYG